jgi:hypothetical protein
MILKTRSFWGSFAEIVIPYRIRNYRKNRRQEHFTKLG